MRRSCVLNTFFTCVEGGGKLFPVGNICNMFFCIYKYDSLCYTTIMEESKTCIVLVSEEKKRIQEELKLMRFEDKIIRKRKTVCNYDCPCKRIAFTNKTRLDPLLFDIRKINSKPYMDDYMKALGISHLVTYV